MVSKYTRKKILFYLTMPFRFDYWMMNNDYSKEWDIKLRELMATNKFRLMDSEYSAWLGNNIIWIANHPYASFYPIKYGDLKIRPSRYTIYLARKKLEKDIFNV